MSNYLETDFFFSLKTVSLMVRVNICWFHMCPFFPTSLLGFEHTWPWDFWSSESKKSACSARDPGSIPGLGDPLEKEIALLAILNLGLLRWLSGKESAWVAGDLGLIPESGRSPGEETSNPLQYSCLENSMDRGAWWAPGVSTGSQRVRHDWATNIHT